MSLVSAIPGAKGRQKTQADPILIWGRIIDPGQGIDGTGSLLIQDGRIAWLSLGEAVPPTLDCTLLDARRFVVSPGFIDMHCHLREPGFESKETIATGTRAAARGGFTTVCCMPNTNPPLDNLATINYVKSKAAAEGVVRVIPIACVTKGRKGEELVNMAELASAGIAGFSDDGDPVQNEAIMRRALVESRRLGLPVIDHCEDKSLSKDGVINEGSVSKKLGLKGIPAAAEEKMVARDLRLAELTGGWLHIAHISTAGSVELLRQARAKGIHFTAEVTSHHLTLTEEALLSSGTNAKVNPPLRTRKDVEAVIKGLQEGIIDIIATDHAPHTRADKDCDISKAAFGISNFETALGSLMSLVHEGYLTLPDLLARLTSAPADILGDRFGKLGTLSPGASADITIFDPDMKWVVEPARFASKGKNTPLAGAKLKGKVLATIFQGNIVYKNESLDLKEHQR